MPFPNSASAEARGPQVNNNNKVAAAQVYLKMQFPHHIIEVLKESSEDKARGARTFSIRNNGQRYVLRVAAEVLELADGATVYLRRFDVAKMLREAGADKAVLVTTADARIEAL